MSLWGSVVLHPWGDISKIVSKKVVFDRPKNGRKKWGLWTFLGNNSGTLKIFQPKLDHVGEKDVGQILTKNWLLNLYRLKGVSTSFFFFANSVKFHFH